MIPAYHRGYVVDACIAVQWFMEEDNSEASVKLLNHYRVGLCRLAVPDWLFFLEVGFALAKKGYPEEVVAKILETLCRYQMEPVKMTWDLLAKANAIAFGYQTSIYEGTYLAVAEEKGFPVVTADKELLRRFKGHSIVLPVWELDFSREAIVKA